MSVKRCFRQRAIPLLSDFNMTDEFANGHFAGVTREHEMKNIITLKHQYKIAQRISCT